LAQIIFPLGARGFMNVFGKILVLVVLVVFGVSCNNSDVDAIQSAVKGVPRKDIDKGRLAINAFANDGRFGSASSQFQDVQSTLGLNRVRILFSWNEGVQPSAGATPNFSFYDSILAGVPSNMRVIVVLTGLPVWLGDESQARVQFVDSWVRAVAQRYGSDGRIEGFQIWNEPNDPNRQDNAVLGFIGSPSSYTSVLSAAHKVVKSIAPGKLVISAATTAINQNYPDSLDYNRGMIDAGAEVSCDVWAIHYYGSQYENVLRNGGVAEVLNGLSRPIWVTESGAQGVNSQLEYGERTWPFLFDNLQGLQRIYIYQYTENSDSSVTYGLRNPSASQPVSDLYVWLRSN
jgi:hypothetical protein